MRHLRTNQGGPSRRMSVVFRVGTEPVEVGETLELGSPDGASLGLFEVVDLWRGFLAVVPAMLVEAARDPVCRTFSGMAAVLGTENQRPVGPGEMVLALVLRDVGSSIQIAQKVPR